MRRYLLSALPLLASLALSASAQAVVVDMHAIGQSYVKTDGHGSPYVQYPADQANYMGVALAPGTRGSLVNQNIPYVASSPPCTDPALPADLMRPNMPESGLCFHSGGQVMHGNETFALVWDPLRQSFVTTKEYVEQFLKDVAEGSGTLTSPYAVTSQYTDNSGRAANASLYGGACNDFGAHGGSACAFSSSSLLPGHEYTPAKGCPATGTNYFYATEPLPEPKPEFEEGPNRVCLTDAQIQAEIKAMVEQTGIVGHTQPGYTPLVTMLTPTGVETCLDAAGKLCSANGSPTPPEPKVIINNTVGALEAGEYKIEISYVTTSGEGLPTVPETFTSSGSTSIKIESPPSVNGVTGWYAYVTQANGKVFARQQASPMAIGHSFTLSATPAPGPEPKPNPYFCSYHSQVNVGGTKVDYVVQPWTAMTVCDEPEAPHIALDKAFQPKVLETELGEQLVSPLSQSHIAAIVNPEMNGWFALDGSEINDDGCIPLEEGLDKVTVAGKSYLLRREFNNGWLLQSDLYVFRCAPSVILEPKFVVPSPIDQGKVVEFDGSVSPSTLVVPAAGYAWELGDGTTAVGPSVEHVYAKGGAYSVKLTLTDRGGNVQSVIQTVNVIGPPVNAGLPAISDLTSLSASNVAPGDTLDVSTGSWMGYPTSTYTYQWQECDAAGGSCTAIGGATAATYTPVAAEVGHTLRVEVTASNGVGSGKATSQQSAVVSVLATSQQSAVVSVLATPALAPSAGSSAGGGSQGASGAPARLNVRLELVPESLTTLLRSGVALVATANEAADGIASISIARSEAKHAHIPYRPSQSVVVIARGTVKGLVNGADHLHLRLSKQIAAKLKRLRHVVLTIQLKAVDSRGESQTVSVTGRY
jgi:PKD domain